MQGAKTERNQGNIYLNKYEIFLLYNINFKANAK